MKHIKKFNESEEYNYYTHEIPNSVAFLQKFSDNPDDDTIYEAMVAFAKEHVKKALHTAANNADVDYGMELNGDFYREVDKKSVIDSYPLDNIK